MTSLKEWAESHRRRQHKIYAVLLIAVGILVIASIIFYSVSSSTQSLGPTRVGQRLGDFRLTDINGKTVNLSDFLGQVVLINAWATWCPPCKAEMPYLNAFYQAHQTDGFVILAINAGDPVGVTAAFANEKNLAFPVLLDPDKTLLSSLGINGLPTSILLDRKGVVKAIHFGPYTLQNLEDEITPVIQK